MVTPDKVKLLPRNAPAWRKSGAVNAQPRLLPGNPVSTRLESGIGNCFPGLECDLRNLERRFFPFLEMDMPDAAIKLVCVDLDGVRAARARGEITAQAAADYEALSPSHGWSVEVLQGTFGPLGKFRLRIADMQAVSEGPRRAPVDPWTAVRMLTEGSDVELVLAKTRKGKTHRITLQGKRARYLGDDGALAEMFDPGELTQSLCSPRTHDFRDCACFYWASNHPDIVLPPLPVEGQEDPKWDLAVPWERRDRATDKPPKPATADNPTPVELRYFEINQLWQSLNFVIERREQVGPYAQRPFSAQPLKNAAELKLHLRYAAGVELAVLQEYLASAYSLKPAGMLSGAIKDDVRAAHAEIMRIALGEMRHLRAVNYVLASLSGSDYTPALGVATAVPAAKPGKTRPVRMAPLSRLVLNDFIAIEAPSQSVDSVYSRILETLNRDGNETQIQAIRTIMAEGEDHYRTFLAIREWLAPHAEDQYLRTPATGQASGGQPQRALQKVYLHLLDQLYKGYRAGLPAGAAALNEARNTMIQPGGIAEAAEAVAETGAVVRFNTPSDPRFAAIAPP